MSELEDWIDEKGWEKQDVDQNLQKLYRFADMIRSSTYYKEYALNVDPTQKDINKHSRVMIEILKHIKVELGGSPMRTS